ncbi:MAG: AzlC family ABC transporter permease [Chloroflexi bacterium]|nr:AzlC family ABC transporter permease [Chloroflexota bacterium]
MRVCARLNRVKGFQRGVLATMPLGLGILAFGLLYGMVARQIGLSPVETLGMSLIVHAGSSQFVALGMWGVASAGAIVLTTLVVNLRHLLMGASIAPYLQGLSHSHKALLALWMSDESYALAMAEYEQGQVSPGYFLGANVGVCLFWWAGGWLGGLLGVAIPDPAEYGLDLVFPLAFLGLLTAFLKDRHHVVVALLSGALAVLGALLLPGKWYVILAGLAGSAVGLLLEKVWRR